MRWVISDAIEKVFISFFHYLSYRGFISRVHCAGFADSRDAENLQGVAGATVRCSGEAPPGSSTDSRKRKQ